MSEQIPETPAATEPTPDEAPKFTQADVDRILAERLKREDVRGLKAKAARLDEIEASNRTDAEKAAAQLAEAQRKAIEAEARAIRYEVAATKGIAKEDADLFLLGADVETITAQADRLLARDGNTRRNGSHVPSEGKTPTKPADPDAEMRAFARQVFPRKE